MASKGSRNPQGFQAARLTGAAFSVLAWTAVMAGPAVAADDENSSPLIPQSVNGALEKLDVKAKPAEPPPEFVTRTRPNPARLHYLPTAVPHAVSPVPVKTPAEIQAAKDALDAAQARQLNPTPPPVDLTKHSATSKPPKAKTAKANPAANAD